LQDGGGNGLEFEVGANLVGLLQTAPWAGLAALALWPEKGVVALLIKRSQAIRIAELERSKTESAVKIEGKKGKNQAQLPAPIGDEE
jgi:hypothetical protein